MSDDQWRDRRRDEDDFSEYGSLFDDAEPTQNMAEVPAEEPISFGDSDTGTLPHWTEPPTGEVPRFDATGGADAPEHDEELDVWSSFSSEAPVWKDDTPAPGAPAGEPSAEIPVQRRQPDRRDTGRHDVVDGPTSGQHRRVTGESEVVAPEPSRITIGTDPSGMPRRPPETGRRRRGGPPPSAARPSAGPPASSGRDMPTAIAVGLVLAAAFIAALMFDPRAAAALIVIILGLAAVEFYDKVAEKGYRPAVVPGVLTCVAAPIACYWLGIGTLPLVITFGFMATSGSFIGARSVEAGPMPNASITTLGIVWIGLLGSFAILILRLSTRDFSALTSFEMGRAEHRGTDTLFLTALGIVANDVGALFIGSAAGRTPLRRWISPNKTVEGLVGGAFFTIMVLMFVGISNSSDTWSSTWDLFILAVVIAILAPMGDLVESMFKRNLDVKDFGTIVKGHGGVLDRFDGFLFVLPGVYYLTLVLEPWTEFVAS
ncbi:MAG: phosphatidate cytidylyltransferase [Ilumatobacter sp.]|nr:phosphatidate cytidylyltransferase [Ilumatobacter sp.]